MTVPAGSLTRRVCVVAATTSESLARHPRSRCFSHRGVDNRQHKRPIEFADGTNNKPRNRPSGRDSPNKPNHHHQPISENKKPLTLQSASNHMATLLQQLSRLDALPPLWDDDHASMTQKEAREALLEETRKIIRQLGEAVQQGDFNISNKNAREVPHLLGQALYIYSHLPGSFKASRDVLAVMRLHRFDIQPDHYENAVLAAALESRWKEAAELFRMRTDPEAHGYSPVHVSVREPVGLYAIAKDALIHGKNPAESVMAVVLNMAMVSPRDNDKCKWFVQTYSIHSTISVLSSYTSFEFERCLGCRSSVGSMWRVPIVAYVPPH